MILYWNRVILLSSSALTVSSVRVGRRSHSDSLGVFATCSLSVPVNAEMKIRGWSPDRRRTQATKATSGSTMYQPLSAIAANCEGAPKCL